jgi:non-specific serine/threonine protein kinase/serine/threonine-protein kinase
MNSGEWHRIQDAFHEILNMKPENARKRLAEIFQDEPHLYEDALSLYQSMEGSNDFLETNAVDRFAAYLNETDTDQNTPLELEGFEIKHAVGSGGMGQVYVAEQQQPRRIVALKVIRQGANRKEQFYRFMAELHALAMMNHPSIAQVYEAGATPNHRPYFTMEYVEGLPITTYCNQNNLGVEARLELFYEICMGLAHAHQKGVIHRDLKPSNILVTLSNGKALPKIIDFGIAKVFDIQGEDWRQQTVAGAVIGTPAYMSPEQANSSDIDTRSDIYACGILLYELLVGKLPLKDEAYERKSLSEILRVIRETQAPPMIRRLKELKEEASEIVEKRNTTLKSLQKSLVGDLQNIVSKSLELDRERRYATIAELGEDIDRYLNRRPINARPKSTRYVISKYISRNRKQLAAAIPMLIVLVIGIYAFLDYRSRSQEATQLVVGITEALKKGMKEENLNRTKRVANPADLVEHILENVELDLVPDKTLAGTLFEMSRSFAAQGNYIKAIEYSKQAYDMYLELYPADHLDRLEAEFSYVLHLYNTDARADALALIPGIINRLNTHPDVGSSSPFTLEAKRTYADILQAAGETERAHEIFTNLLETITEIRGPEHYLTCTVRHNLAQSYADRGKYLQAKELHQENYDIRLRNEGKVNVDTLSSQIGLGRALANLNKDTDLEKSLELLKEATRLSERHIQYFSETTAYAFFTYARALYNSKRFEDAEQAYDQSLEIFIELNGETDVDTLFAMNNLSYIYFRLGKLDKALDLKLKEKKGYSKTSSENLSKALQSMTTLGQIYHAKKMYSEAEETYKDILARQQEHHPDNQRLKSLILGLKAATSYAIGNQQQAQEELAIARAGLREGTDWRAIIEEANLDWSR